MEENNNSAQEKFYNTINKTITDALKILKYAIYPLAIIFILVVIIWGVDIIKLHNQLETIKNELDLKIQSIDIKQRETNLLAEEKLNLLKEKLISIDSSFNALESEYKKALKGSSDELNKLQNNSKKVGDITKSISDAMKLTLNEYKDAKTKYSNEIQYASKGAELRKKDIEEMYIQSKHLLLNLTDILETTNQYINANVKGLLATHIHDEKKVTELNVKLENLLSTFRKQLNN